MNRRRFLLGLGGAGVAFGAAALGWRASVGSMAEYAAYAGRLRRPLDPGDLTDLIRYAGLAANGHNTQPWQFRIGDGVIEALPDFTRRTPAVDPDDHHLHVSLGCAVENLAIAATAAGHPGEVVVAPDGAAVRYAFTGGPARRDPLCDAIPKRQSTRAEYDGRQVAAADLAALEAAAQVPGIGVVLITERSRITAIRDLVLAGNTAQMADPAFLRELKDWIRFNPAEAMMRGDGLLAAATGNPSLPAALGRIAFDRFFDPAGENDKYARQIDSAAGIAVFTGARADRAHWIAAGRACQRFALAATSLGLKTSFINQPVEVPALRPELAAAIGAAGQRPDIVMRFGFGPMLPYAPRRAVSDILVG